MLLRGRGERILVAPTKNNFYVVGTISKDDKNSIYHVKLFYLCKFFIKFKKSKLYDQVPVKIMRQLQDQARKLKYSDKIIQNN